MGAGPSADASTQGTEVLDSDTLLLKPIGEAPYILSKKDSPFSQFCHLVQTLMVQNVNILHRYKAPPLPTISSLNPFESDDSTSSSDGRDFGMSLSVNQGLSDEGDDPSTAAADGRLPLLDPEAGVQRHAPAPRVMDVTIVQGSHPIVSERGPHVDAAAGTEEIDDGLRKRGAASPPRTHTTISIADPDPTQRQRQRRRARARARTRRVRARARARNRRQDSSHPSVPEPEDGTHHVFMTLVDAKDDSEPWWKITHIHLWAAFKAFSAVKDVEPGLMRAINEDAIDLTVVRPTSLLTDPDEPPVNEVVKRRINEWRHNHGNVLNAYNVTVDVFVASTSQFLSKHAGQGDEEAQRLLWIVDAIQEYKKHSIPTNRDDDDTGAGVG